MGGSLGLWAVGLGFGDRGSGFGMGSLVLVVGDCLGFGRAWHTDFGVGRVGCGIGCGEFWGVVLGFGWDRWGSRVDKEQLGGGTRTAQKLIEGRGNRPRKKYWGKGSTDHAKSSRGEGATERAKSIGGSEHGPHKK